MISETYTLDYTDTKYLQIQKFQLIEDPNACSKIVEEILIHQKIIALDCEGIFLSREGKLTLIQISLVNEDVFIFDILKGGPDMFLGYEGRKGLKDVLENKKILKLIHDCRNDWDSLLYQFSVRLYNFVDTQEAFFVFKLFHFQEITLPISLMNFIEGTLQIKLKYKDQFKNDINMDPYLWGKRPIDDNNLNYAAEDVAHLIKAWIELREKFNPNMKEIVYFLTIIKVVDVPMFHQFREYLIANIIYFNVLDNVFDSKEILNFIFSIDYIYNFLQIKLICNEDSENKLTSNKECPNNSKNKLEDDQNKSLEKINNKTNNSTNYSSPNTKFFFDDEYKSMFKSQENSLSLIKLGMDYKKKQKINFLRSFNFDLHENIGSKSFQENHNDSYSEFVKDLNNIKSFEDKSEKIFKKKLNRFPYTKINCNNNKNHNVKNYSIRNRRYNLNTNFNNRLLTKEKSPKKDSNLKLIDINDFKEDQFKSISRSDSIENLKAEPTNKYYSKGFPENKDVFHLDDHDFSNTCDLNNKNLTNEETRKLSINLDSIRKISNFSNISQYYHSDSDKNMTFINNDDLLQNVFEHENDIPNNKSNFNNDLKKNSIKNNKKDNNRKSLSQSIHRDVKKISLYKKFDIVILNENIVKKNIWKSAKNIKKVISIIDDLKEDYNSLKNKDNSIANDKILDSQKSENVKNLDINFKDLNNESLICKNSSPSKIKNIPEKLENVINIENFYDFDKNAFNQSLYDTIIIETKIPSINNNSINNLNTKNNPSEMKKKNSPFFNNYNYYNFFNKNNYYYNNYKHCKNYSQSYFKQNPNYNSTQKFSCLNNRNNNYFRCTSNYYNNYLQNSSFINKINQLSNIDTNKESICNFDLICENSYNLKDNSILPIENKKRNSWNNSKNNKNKNQFVKEITEIQEEIIERDALSLEKAKNIKNNNQNNISNKSETQEIEVVKQIKSNKKANNTNKNNKNFYYKNQRYFYNNCYQYYNNFYPYKNSKKNNKNYRKNNSKRDYNLKIENNLDEIMQNEINLDDHRKQDKKNQNNSKETQSLNEALVNEVENPISSILENININNSFNINIDKETFNLKKIIFKESEGNSSTKTSSNSKKIVYFEYDKNYDLESKETRNKENMNISRESSMEKIDIKIDLKNETFENNIPQNTNINNYFYIYLPKTKCENKSFSLEININKQKNCNFKKQNKIKSNIFKKNKNVNKSDSKKSNIVTNEENQL